MKHRSLYSASFVAAMAGSMVLPTPCAHGQTTTSWDCRVALYGWAETLEGDVTLNGNNVPVDAGFSDILDQLDYAVMGAVEVGYGKWSLLSDLMLSQISASSHSGLTQIDAEMKQFIGNFVVTYNVLNSPATRFDVYAGARVNALDVSLDIQTQNLGASGDSGNDTWIDPIVGARFQQNLSEKFLVRAMGDVGGFGAASDFTWQAMAALGYRLCDNAQLLLGYRGIGSDYTHNGFGYDVITHGILFGLEAKF